MRGVKTLDHMYYEMSSMELGTRETEPVIQRKKKSSDLEYQVSIKRIMRYVLTESHLMQAAFQ